MIYTRLGTMRPLSLRKRESHPIGLITCSGMDFHSRNDMRIDMHTAVRLNQLGIPPRMFMLRAQLQMLVQDCSTIISVRVPVNPLCHPNHLLLPLTRLDLCRIAHPPRCWRLCGRWRPKWRMWSSNYTNDMLPHNSGFSTLYL